MDNEVSNLRSKILDAFSSVPHPGRENITGHECEECDELRDTFSLLQSDAVPPEIIDNNSGQLPLFTPEAYIYFLPAYLLKCLDNFDPDNMVCEFVIYSLSPDDSGDGGGRWAAERHELFNEKQKEAVAAFLEHILATKEFKDFHVEAADGLRKHWIANPENAI